MHALMIASRPALLYWEAATVAVIHTVYELRRSGLAAYFSIDAGPQVKVLCQPDDCARVAAALQAVPGVLEVLDAEPGPGAAVLEVQS
jgi:diphosphomevalonate decarboxylase